MLAYVLAIIVVLAAALLAFGIAALLHLQGWMYVAFVTIILVVGIAAAIAIVVVHVRSKKQRALEESGSGESRHDLELLLDDADRKLRTAQQGARRLQYQPLIYVLGDPGSAKTTSVVKSGLELELLAGAGFSESGPVSTSLLNVWFTRMAAIVELGTAFQQNSGLLTRLVQRTRPKSYRAAFGSGAAPRAALVCLSVDSLLVSDGGETLLTSARKSGAQLREISRILGTAIPVYVLLTKLDRVPHFEQYVRSLSDAEISQVFGAPLGRPDAAIGTYADQTSRLVSAAFDTLVFQLCEFRLESLAREHDAASLPSVYEFPREFGKLRKNLSQYLVELCKPSQLSANPYLRGFYFAGVRARIVERTVAVPAQEATPADSGATQFIRLSMLQGNQAPQPVQQVTSSRVPQWTFLARLLPEVILGDKSALAFTRQSAPARLFRRILFGGLAILFASYVCMLAVSYVHNAALEQRIGDAARTLESSSREASALSSPDSLRALDNLRQVIEQLEGYRQDGAPLGYRFGLYRGNQLDDLARRIYFDHFRPLLLNSTQASFVSYLKSLPDAPLTTSDMNSYQSAYNALKAYLITTNHPEKSQSKFLTPVFSQYWVGPRTVDPGERQLAEKQMDFYAAELLRRPPYQIDPDFVLVSRTQSYLSKFLAGTRIYENMLADADKAANAVDFNKKYPDAVPYVSDGHVVRGAFTRAGFDVMQTAFAHPENYARGETWVLGNPPGQSQDLDAVIKDLRAQYSSDFLKEWHEFLLSAHVGGCGSLKTAPNLLNALSGPASPLLELFFTVSYNTAVNDPQIKSTFQPARALVDPGATDQLISDSNRPYISALSQIATGLGQAVAQNPNLTTDPSAFAQVSPQIAAADAAARQLWQKFAVDPQWHTETTVLGLLESPVHCLTALAPSPGAPAGAGGAKLCLAINPLLARFPFAANAASQASLQEVDQVFAPETGVLWQTYNTLLKPFLAPSGAGYAPSPTAPQPVNPRFVAYFNRANHLSTTLYPAGQKSATFTVTLKFIPTSGVSSASFSVDGQRGPTGASSQTFTWVGATAQRASLIYNGQEVLPSQGTWALFQLVRIAQFTRLAAGVYRLEYPIVNQMTVSGHAVGGATGSAAKATFELSGPGAEFLVGDGFTGFNCVPAVAK
ncbi:MAG TPA: ImcF-related family protein [Terracidiphilus sp.]|nr:ImcF-related family protein [Terracidiphilus sp.]